MQTTIRSAVDHVVLVLDESYSMDIHRSTLIAQTDGLVKHLAVRSQENDRETRVSIWVFHSEFRCIVWDKDVLRLPSIAEFYRPQGRTALVDATIDAIESLREIPERHGEHGFLMYVLTDGQENESRIHGPGDLRKTISGLPDNWTVAALVPTAQDADYARRVGFPAGNVETWDATSGAGLDAVSARIKQTTDRWQTDRAKGVRSTTTLFSTGSDVVNAKTVARSGLISLTKGSYDFREVKERYSIRTHVEDTCHMAYRVGNGFYQLTKRETIQAGKQVAIVSKADGTVYVGYSARRLLNLPDMDVKVKPDVNPEFDIFVQSTSTNRILLPGTWFLYLR